MAAHAKLVQARSPSDELSPSPSTSTIDTGASLTGGLTKAWELPPRPKPGRKPATDTPPSKRKAQNREAQRAFRERRAARVGELEEELRQRQRETDAEKQDLNAGFEAQRQALQQDIATWRVRSEHWERIAKEKDGEIAQLRKQVEEAMLQLRFTSTSTVGGGTSSTSSSTSAPAFAPRKPWDQPLSPAAHQRPPILPLPIPKIGSRRQTEPSTPSADCRSCGQGGHCACIEKVLNNLPHPNMAPSPPASNGTGPSEVKQEHDEMEIDFTSKFAGPAASRSHLDHNTDPIVLDGDETTSVRPPGGCGFCTDDSNCVCIENSRHGPTSPYDITSASIHSPHSVPDIVPLHRRPSAKSKPQPLEPASGPGGPGTCPSCVMDPERRRFCQALAGIKQQPERTRGSKRPAPSPLTSNSSNLPSIDSAAHLSCSQTYDLLREKLPDFATKRDNPAFIQQLRTSSHGSSPGKDAATVSSPYEVEAASVLSVLAHARGGSYSDGHSNATKKRR